MNARDQSEHRPWHSIEIPAEVSSVPGMLSGEEIRYYIWLTETQYEGIGAIIDLGAWLGQSAVSLACGLVRGGKEGRVASYDRFVWESGYMSRYSDVDLADGIDFMPEFLRQVAPYAARIEVEKQDLMNFRWLGGPIEFLIVDAAKSWSLTNAILSGFGPSLIPGKSRVAFQDFRNTAAHWLPLVVDSRPDIWEEVESTAWSDTVTFRLRRQLFGEGGIKPDYSNESFSWQQARDLFEARIEREPAEVRPRLRHSLFRKLALDAPREEIEAFRQKLRTDPAKPTDEEELQRLADVSPLLMEFGWEALKRGDLERAEQLGLRCLERAPSSEDALSLLCRVARTKGDSEVARQYAQKMLDRDPRSIRASLSFAEIDVQEGCLDRAAKVLRSMLSGLPEDHKKHSSWTASVMSQLAWATYSAGMLEESRCWITESLSANDQCLSAWQAKVALALEKSELQAAERSATQGLAIDPANKTLRIMQIQIDRLKGDRDIVERAMAVLTESPDSRAWLVDYTVKILGEYWQETGDYGGACESLGVIADRWPRCAESCVLLARLHLHLGDKESARRAYEKALERKPDHHALAALGKSLE